MKLHGKTISRPQPEVVVIPRDNGDHVFKLQAVLNMDEFDKLCPEPKPPTVRHKDGTVKSDMNDAKYIKKLDKIRELRFSYMLIKSLEATEGLEWERVVMLNPDTWLQWKDELIESGLTDHEVQRIIAAMFEANGITEKRYDEARARFIRMQAGRGNDLSSQMGEQETTPSGVPAKDSE